MGVRTRSATSSPVKQPLKRPSSQAEHIDPLNLFILPKNSLSNARFLLLQHPRDGSRKRFYLCPQQGLYEFTKISAASIDPRSILFTPIQDGDGEDAAGDCLESAEAVGTGVGYVNKAAEFFVATPFDASFLLVPILLPQKTEKSLFRPMDDILESQLDEDKHLNYIFKHRRQLLEDAMNRICDTVEAGDENMYRLSEEKLLRYFLTKCERVVAKGLPSSLEDKFVTRALEAPVLSIKWEESNISTVINTSGELPEAESESFDTQSSTASATPSAVFSEAASVATVNTILEDDETVKLRHLQRLRTVFSFIVSSYTPPHITSRLTAHLDADTTAVNFAPLSSHLTHLATLRAKAASSRSIGDFSRKRNIEEDNYNETREEKRRKLAEEEKRKKAGESMGVRALKKVDVSGMKKMSAFFTKATPKIKP